MDGGRTEVSVFKEQAKELVEDITSEEDCETAGEVISLLILRHEG